MEKIKKIYHFLAARLAYWFYGRPARKLIVIGVTGTKGKSTTCRFIASVLEAAGHKVGLLTTVEFQIAEKRWLNDKKMTMLGRGQIQRMLRQMIKAGCRYAVVETSSQGILQYRHTGLDYDVAVFTNLAPEHVEAHGGFENLRKDKGKIFAGLLSNPRKFLFGETVKKIIAANLDDENAQYFLGHKADKKIGYTLKNKTAGTSGAETISGRMGEESEKGPSFFVGDKKYSLNILGQFNAYNALAAVAVAKSQGISEEAVARGLESVKLVEGRMEPVEAGQDFKVIVDYAHEPLSFLELFKSLRKMAAGRVISVIGSDGGGRDKGKREKMGEIAGLMTDYVVVTDVNSFDEDPKEIAEMLAKGARKAGKKDGQDLFVETDRRKGIEKAISLARTGDAVAITAKGTEQCICAAGGKKIPWDDRKVAREVLTALQSVKKKI